MVIWGLEYCRLLALGLGWLEALQWRPPTLPTQFSRSAFGFGNLVPFESSLRWGALFWICGPRLLNVATGGVWDLFVLLPKILGCWGFFARAFLLGRLVLMFDAGVDISINFDFNFKQRGKNLATYRSAV